MQIIVYEREILIAAFATSHFLPDDDLIGPNGSIP